MTPKKIVPVQAAAHFSILVLCVWLLDIVSGLIINSALIADRAAPFTLKALLFAADFSVWAVILILPAVILGICYRISTIHPLLKKFMSLCFLILAWVFTFYYLSSWAFYVRAREFMGFDGVYFLRWNFSQFLDHIFEVEAKAFYQLVMASLIMAFSIHGLVKFLSRWTSRQSENQTGIFYLRCISGLSLAAFIFGLAAPQINRQMQRQSPAEIIFGRENNRYSRSELFRYLLHYHTGPVVRLVMDAYEYKQLEWLLQKQKTDALPYLTREENKVVSLGEYLQGVSDKGLKKYNVVFILVESLRPDRLRLFGAQREVLPNVDRLAEKSWVFNAAYSQSSHSDYADLCMLNSQYPLRGRVHYYYPVNPTYPRVLIYDILKAVGYKTALISSQNEKWGGMLNYLDTGGLEKIIHAENSEAETYVEYADSGFVKRLLRGEVNSGKVEDSHTIDHAIRWVTENKDQPFFLHVNLQNSHFPYHIPKGMKPKYEPFTMDFPVSFVYYPKDKLPVMRNRYDSCFYHMDELIGKFLTHLESLGLMEKTIVVFTGDNGEAFYEHGTVTHATNLWNEVIRVPLVMYVPGEGHKLWELTAQHVDIPPTVLGLIGLAPHPSFQGIDLRDESKPKDRRMFFVVQTDGGRQTAMIDPPYKLIRDWQSQKHMLFDLEHDPREKNDLVRHKTAVFASLTKQLAQWESAQLLYYESPEINSKYYPPDF